MTTVPILLRDLTAFEHTVMEHVCEGMTNAAIARDTAHTEKVVENTVSRTAQAFTLPHGKDTNVRVLLALAYRSHFGDKAFDKFALECHYVQVGPDGQRSCNRHV